MSSQLEDAFNEAVERRVADIRAHLLSQDTAEAMQLAIVNTHMEDKRPEMWASAAVYTSAALAVVSSALAASSADPLADENPPADREAPDEEPRDANEYLAQIADYSPSEVADAIDSVRAQIKDALAATDSRGKPDGASVPDQSCATLLRDDAARYPDGEAAQFADLVERSAPSPSDSGWTPTSDGPEPIEYECELCGGSLDGPYEKCGSAQHGPNGTVIYGRAVPVSPIPGASSVPSRATPAGTGEARPVMPNISAAGPSVYKPDKRPAPPVPEGQDEASKSNPDEQEVDGA